MPLIKNFLKLSVVAGAVYVTFDKEMWELGTGKGKKLMDEAKKNFFPETVEFFDKTPSKDELRKNALEKYNQSIQSSFKFMADAPSKVNEYGKQLLEKFKS